jgi:hypothetical protein
VAAEIEDGACAEVAPTPPLERRCGRSLRCAPADAVPAAAALASVGVFTELDGRRFALTPLAELLRSDGPGSMRALGRMYGSEQYRAWGDLLESVRTGRPAFDRTFGASYPGAQPGGRRHLQ